jgi:hypothetical protein
MYRPKLFFEGVARGVAGVLKTTIHGSGEKIRKGIASGAPVELQPSAKIFVEILLNACPVEVEAELEIVFVEFPGKIINELIVAVHAVTRNSGSATSRMSIGDPSGVTELAAGTFSELREYRRGYRSPPKTSSRASFGD